MQDMRRTYITVWGALAIVTFIELGVTYTGLSKAMQTIAIGTLSVLKASLVIAFFMHMLHEPKQLKYVGIVSLAIAALIVVFLVAPHGSV